MYISWRTTADVEWHARDLDDRTPAWRIEPRCVEGVSPSEAQRHRDPPSLA